MKPVRTVTVMALTTGFGLVVHPLGMVVASVLGRRHLSMSFNGYSFFTGFALVPLLVLVGVGGLITLRLRPGLGRTWALTAGAWSAPLFALAAQVVGWTVAPTDAQGALAFLFLPGYAAVASALLSLTLFLAGWCVERLRHA